MDKRESVTVWFGKEIDIENVKNSVRKLHNMGYLVRAPFYIGYNIDTNLVREYLEHSLDVSNFLYIIGTEGSLLEEIVDYAQKTGKPIIKECKYAVCCQ